MKMEELVQKVSGIYRENLAEVSNWKQELWSVEETLAEAERMEFKNISYADYQGLINRKAVLEERIKLKTQFCEGVSCVREILMDLGFDTVMEKRSVSI